MQMEVIRYICAVAFAAYTVHLKGVFMPSGRAKPNPFSFSFSLSYANWQICKINIIMLTEGLALDHLFQYHITH